MARAEVVWEDQPGVWRGSLARIEDTSRSGACIRVSAPISVGARLKIKWHREEFSGIAKYCRRDGGDYVLGIQRETNGTAARTTVLLHHATSSLAMSSLANIQDPPVQQEKNAQQLSETVAEQGPAPVATNAVAAPVAAEAVLKIYDAPARRAETEKEFPKVSPEQVPAPAAVNAVASPVAAEDIPIVANEGEAANKSTPVGDPAAKLPQESETDRRNELRAREPSKGQERTIVLNKLLHLGSGRQQQSVPDGKGDNTKAQVNSTDAKTNRENQTNTKAKPTELPPNQGTLLSLQDIYLALGIMSSRLGYSIDTVSAMVDSDHMKGMTSDVKRASVLMALEAAGIPVHELLQDGAKRLDALNAYEAGERKRFEEYEARKAQESAQIQMEIEDMTAHCLERIKHNLGEVTQAKDALLNWQTTKQKEAQRISEAVALFTKPPAAVQPSDSKPVLQTVGAVSKP